MIETIITKIGALLLTPVVFLSTFFVQPVQAPVIEDEALGVALPSGTALFETSLASPITGSASSLTLVANSIRGGGSLSGYQCFTIDEGSAQAEYVCGTVSGTSVTSLERGLSPSDGITQTSALQFSHRRGASVKITDFPLIQRLKSQASGTGTYENVLTYAAGVTPTNSGDLADREYVLSVITGTSTVSYDKHVIQGTAGETMATGSIVYLRASDSRWYKADNDLPETYVDQNLGIAQGPGTSGSSISNGVLTYGLDSTQRSLTPGGFVFLSATAGATSTATTSQVLGKAISASTMFFDQNVLDSYSNASATFAGTTTFTGLVKGVSRTTTYTASTTYTKPTGLKYIELEMWGGGGGGASDSTDAGGGGGGAYINFKVDASLIGSTATITIGKGGSGSSGPGAGGAGSSTIFSLSTGDVIAYGGAGGTSGANRGATGGGIVSHGTTTDTTLGTNTPNMYKGMYGSNSAYIKTYWGGGAGGWCNGANDCGEGGDSIYGGGGGGGGRTNAQGNGGTSIFGGAGGAGVTSGTATSGSVPGGGGGAAGNSGTSGAGGNGMVRITEYF